jgi:hypothetical protein
VGVQRLVVMMAGRPRRRLSLSRESLCAAREEESIGGFLPWDRRSSLTELFKAIDMPGADHGSGSPITDPAIDFSA